jgi:aspartyl-tRNA(Asn)/glutamyl-tRNA(Gln) amidotransferase subunit A
LKGINILKSLKQMRKALDSREISVKELTHEYLERAKAQNTALNAFITITEEEALQNAETAQKIIDSGAATALTGIPYTLKDNICVAGIKMTNGSKMLEDFTPFYSAKVAEDLKAQGAVLIGKTNMDEFAMGNSNRTSYFGNVHNPHNLERVPGGSSGGSAAAVAADLCAYSIGTDTGGSIRQPASHCGITGLKPTYERISRNGVTAFAGAMDTVGTFTRTAQDSAILMSSLCSEKQEDFTSRIGKDIKGLKIAIISELFTQAVDVNVRDSINNLIKKFEAAGAFVSEVSLPTVALSAPAYFCLSSAQGVAALSRFDGFKYGLRGQGATYDEQLRDSRTRGFGEEVKRRLLIGNYVLSGNNMELYYKKAQSIRQQICREFDEVFTKADVIISPTSVRSAFSLDEPSDFVKIYSSTMYTVPMNLAGLPCVSTPCNNSTNFNNGEMPIGVSVTGKRFDEATVLQIADFVENVHSGGQV